MTEPEGADVPPPAFSKIRARIAEEAARILAAGGDSERARYRAARRVARGWVPPDQIPAHDEVRRELLRTQAPSHASAAPGGDRLERLAALVAPLALVRPDPAQHPADDALGQALRTFALVAEERPFDEELLTAALVHDVGVAIDRRAAVAAGLAALAGLVTERTRWLIENLPAARAYRSGTLGYRARRRLEGHEDFLDLLLLADADRRARSCGRAAGTLDDAVATLRALADPD